MDLKVKFCGMRDNNALACAVDLGVRYIGFVIDFPRSPRSISIGEFHRKVKWLRNNRNGNYKVVAVTVDMPLDNLEFIIGSGMADVIQLHGNEHISVCRLVSKQVETWKALNTKDEIKMNEITVLARSVSKILLDSGSAMDKAKNSSGTFENTALYTSLIKEGIEVVLSGGLDANNIGCYLKTFNPDTIDISRGIELEPGVKSKQKMYEFMEAVKRFYSDEYKTDEEE